MADTDLDHYVGIQDLGNLANRYGQSGTFRDGDTDGNGQIDIMDLGMLAAVYQQSFASPSVPEPASLMLMGVGAIAVLRRKR